MLVLIFTLFTFTLSSKHPKINIAYNHTHKTIQLYSLSSSSSPQPINLRLSFTTKDLLLHESLINQTLYLDQHKKHKINLTNAKYEYKISKGYRHEDDGIVGSVGVGAGGALYEIVRKMFNSSGAKLMVR